MRKSKITNFASLRNRIALEAGGITQNLFQNTEDFVNDISKEISRIDWEGIYRSRQKNIKLAVKKGNKVFVKSLRKIRKTETFKLFTKEVPRYFNSFIRWSVVRLRKLRNLTVRNYYLTKRTILKKYPRVQIWVGSKYPKVRNFVKENYPKFESFILNKMPLYRMVYFGNR